MPKETVKEQPTLIRGMGGFGWISDPIPPHSHQTYPYSCPVEGDGRIVRLWGRTHAHGVRETVWINHGGGDRVKVFEQYDYREQQIFNYDSVTTNPPFSSSSPGAFTGRLDVHSGDTLDWECEVNNDSDVGLRYVNEVQTGEMCNIWGFFAGGTINCLRQ